MERLSIDETPKGCRGEVLQCPMPFFRTIHYEGASLERSEKSHFRTDHTRKSVAKEKGSPIPPRSLVEVEVDEVLRLMCDVGAEVATDNHVPKRRVPHTMGMGLIFILSSGSRRVSGVLSKEQLWEEANSNAA